MVDDRKEHVQRKHNEKPRPDEPVLLGTAIDLVLARILGTLNAEPERPTLPPTTQPGALAAFGRGGRF